ncbi:MAG: preprotein translocase subunit SecG [Betaproteobacteria bacterium]|nr:preprotein translocase subunit SecG [Betaproteobacteria bacterium]
MHTAILILHVLVAAGIIGLVLLQHGKGADMGAAFGSGSAGSLFGSSGSANFLSRATGVLTAIFFVTSLALTYLSAGKSESGGVMAEHLPVQQESQPAPAGGNASQPAATEAPDASKAKEIPK